MNDFDNDKIPESLKQHKDKNPYKVPEGYFDSFYSKLPLEKEKKPTSSKVIRLGLWKYAIAASVIGIIAISTVQFQRTNMSQQAMVSLSSIEWEDLDEVWSDFQTQEILSLYSDEEIESMDIGFFDSSEDFLDDFFEEELDDEDLELLFENENI